MAYELAFDGQHIQTNGDRVDDIDHLWEGTPLQVWYSVVNNGDDAVPERYDFLSITDNSLNVTYEDWAARESFEDSAEHAFEVPVALATGIHWVFVTIDARSEAPPVAARMVVVARNDAERMRLLEELSPQNS